MRVVMAKFACARPSTFNGAIMRIAIYGLGYVGLTGAICLASEGHHLFGPRPNRLAALSRTCFFQA